MTPPYYTSPSGQLYHGDALAVLRELPCGAAHMAVTSPSYWNLRDYGVPGQYGLEDTVQEYIDTQVRVFRELRRVLRPDGLCFVNIGSSYAGGKGQSGQGSSEYQKERAARGESLNKAHHNISGPKRTRPTDDRAALRLSGYKPLDLIDVPALLAEALRQDGWYLRKKIVWWKAAPMPESVQGTRWERHRVKVKAQIQSTTHQRTREGFNPSPPHPDNGIVRQNAEYIPCPGCAKCLPNGGLVLRRGSWRPTSSHEHILMLSVSDHYYADGEGVREACQSGPSDIKKMNESLPRIAGKHKHLEDAFSKASETTNIGRKRATGDPSGRNLRDVWRLKSDGGFDGAHYATFPKSLPSRSIRIGTSDRGVCPACGAPWARVVETPSGGTTGRSWHDHSADAATGNAKVQSSKGYVASRTISWRPTCTCDAGEPIPATVIDPYMGSGTTALAATEMDRRWIGIDLSEDYCRMAVRRLAASGAPQIGMGV